MPFQRGIQEKTYFRHNENLENHTDARDEIINPEHPESRIDQSVMTHVNQSLMDFTHPGSHPDRRKEKRKQIQNGIALQTGCRNPRIFVIISKTFRPVPESFQNRGLHLRRLQE